LPAALAADWLTCAWDQNAGMTAGTPAAAAFEEIALRWVLELLQLPASCSSALVTGAQMANTTCLAAARNSVLSAVGHDVEARGLIGAPMINLVVGAERHDTIVRALRLLGLGASTAVMVAADERGAMRADALADVLQTLSGPTIVCAQIGNVNTGAIDPMGSVCDAVDALRARVGQQAVWLHADAAFGLWARASSHYAHLAAGSERADSWATDAHKWLNTSYDCGIVLVRDPEALKATVSFRASYLTMASDFREPADYTPESSRRARGVEVWAALASLGRDGLADLVERCCGHAQHFAEGLKQAGYEVLNDVELNQVVACFGDDAVTETVMRGIQEEGTCWCGPTHWRGRSAVRISVSGWSTTRADVERSLEAILAVAAGACPAA
jgi:glutamate/tyrosine decarboxylase-like PLP-dependent enzyme